MPNLVGPDEEASDLQKGYAETIARLNLARMLGVSAARAADSELAAVSEPDESTDDALAAIALRRQKMKLKHAKQVLKLRKKLANYAIWIVIAQLLFANAFFFIYLIWNTVDPNPTVMVAWLSSTVVEVIGILWVIARNLFPYVDKSPAKSKSKSSAASP